MNDKEFSLLEKIYVELQETKAEVKRNSNHIIRLENEFHDKFGALNDEVKIIREDVAHIKDRLDSIEKKVERHDIKIQVIEGGKARKSAK